MSENLPAKRDDDEPLFDIPIIKDEIHLVGDRIIPIDNETAEIRVHRNHAEMDHLFVRRLGAFGIRIFDIHPIKDYLIERGYTLVVENYPNIVTQRTWLLYMLSQIDQEWENGIGHEFDDEPDQE